VSSRIFVIEDDFHAQWLAKHRDLEAALAEIREWSNRPWDAPPNRCPCTSWRTCGRDYVIIEYDTLRQPWAIMARHRVLSISAKGLIWHEA
jgi:hypothetical protein